jgi:hypothetical protein
MFSTTARRATGLAGLAGAALFLVGDMLFYGYWGPGNTFETGMRTVVEGASVARLYAGGLLGPLAAALCILGFWHVYLNVRPGMRRSGVVMLVLLVAMMISGSAVHTLWAARGLAWKFCAGGPQSCSSLVAATDAYWVLAYDTAAVPGYAGLILLGLLVVTRRTWYPAWTVVANPGVLILLSPLAATIPEPLGAPLVGGSTNLAITLFFVVSLVTTWQRREPTARQPGASANQPST